MIISGSKKIAAFIGVSFAGMALISGMSRAQAQDFSKAKPGPWVPFNAASELATNPLSVPTRASEIGMFGISSPGSTIAGIIANYKITMGNFVGGLATVSSRTTDSNGKTSSLADLRMGGGTNEFQAGIRLPFTDVGNGLESGQASFQVRGLNQQVAGAYVRAGIDFAPGTNDSKACMAASADVIKGGVAVSAALTAKNGKKPNGAFGLEGNLGKGFQLGASLHPEREFFKGRMQPNLLLRWASKNSTFNVNVQPHQKAVKVGVGLRF